MTKVVKQAKLTLVKSVSGRLKKHQLCVRGLGLRKMNQSVVVDVTPSVLGMMTRVSYLLEIEELI